MKFQQTKQSNRKTILSNMKISKEYEKKKKKKNLKDKNLAKFVERKQVETKIFYSAPKIRFSFSF